MSQKERGITQRNSQHAIHESVLETLSGNIRPTSYTEDSSEVIYIATKPKSTVTKAKANATVKPIGGSKRKLSEHQEDLVGNEDRCDNKVGCKRKHSIARPNAMGMRVSQLVHGYEQQQHIQALSSYQITTASNNQKYIFTKNRATSATHLNSALEPPHCHHISHATACTMPSRSLPFTNTPSPLLSRSTPVQSQNRFESKPVSAKKPRFWECHRCGMRGGLYNFNAHVSDQLDCPRSECQHKCCRRCVVDSVGEECEEHEWHKHPMGYWGWMMIDGCKIKSEDGEARTV